MTAEKEQVEVEKQRSRKAAKQEKHKTKKQGSRKESKKRTEAEKQKSKQAEKQRSRKAENIASTQLNMASAWPNMTPTQPKQDTHFCPVSENIISFVIILTLPELVNWFDNGLTEQLQQLQNKSMIKRD